MLNCSFIQNRNFMEWQCLRSRAAANTQLCIMKYAELISTLTKLSADNKNRINFPLFKLLTKSIQKLHFETLSVSDQSDESNSTQKPILTLIRI